MNITERQMEALRALHDHMKQHGNAPSGKQLATAMGLTNPTSGRVYLLVLERKGLIALTPRQDCSAIILDAGERLLRQRRRKVVA
jgi:SOS-response transcriptional repressor LexA